MASLGGGYKPLVRITTKMDVSMAMAILDFPPSQAFEHLDLIDVEKRFMFKIHQVQLEAHGTEMLTTSLCGHSWKPNLTQSVELTSN